MFKNFLAALLLMVSLSGCNRQIPVKIPNKPATSSVNRSQYPGIITNGVVQIIAYNFPPEQYQMRYPSGFSLGISGTTLLYFPGHLPKGTYAGVVISNPYGEVMRTHDFTRIE